MHFLAIFVILLALAPVSIEAEVCKDGVPVCGFKEFCVEGACEFYQTYNNICDMKDAGAEMMHRGECGSGGEHALSRFLSVARPLFPQGLQSYDFYAFFTAIVSRLFLWI